MTGEHAERVTFLGHPRGLIVLFFAEMWERFSFYGMRSLLVLYLTQHFLFSDNRAQGLYAAYASLVYLTPLVGGLIADRYLGARKSVLIGAVFLTLGHIAMAFEGSGAKQYLTYQDQRWEIQAEGRGEKRVLFAANAAGRQPLEFRKEGAVIAGTETAAAVNLPAGQFKTEVKEDPVANDILLIALSLIIVGVGFLKANISALVGALYDQNDIRRDSGFTIFITGINLGSLLSTALCGWIGIVYGWKYGFGLAGLGMVAGLLVFMWGRPLLEGRGEAPEGAGRSWEGWAWIGGTLALLPLWWLLQRDETVASALTVLAPAIFIAMFGYIWVNFRAEERSRMMVAIVLVIFAVVFFMLFDQAGSSMTLYASRNSELTLFDGFSLTAAQTNLFNPLIIVTVAPIIAWMWVKLARAGREPNVPVKFAIALMLVGIGFLVLVYGATNFARETTIAGETRLLVPLIWLILAYLFHTLGEIFLSPVGLSMITKLSVPRLVGLMMGVWFLASSLAHTLAGQIAKSTSTETIGGVVVDPRGQLEAYIAVFTSIGWLGIGVGLLLLGLAPLLNRGMAGVK